MNTHKFKFILMLVLGLVFPFTSCKDYLDVNVNPNQSSNSRVSTCNSVLPIIGTAIGIGQRIYFPSLAFGLNTRPAAPASL